MHFVQLRAIPLDSTLFKNLYFDIKIIKIGQLEVIL